jgi:ABC-type multidrug transport system ATPase subunit
MSLLELEHLAKSYGDGSARRVALADASLTLDSGELVAIWGVRRSGRSTLLRIAAGLVAADSGVVRFAGSDLSGKGRDALRVEIGYCRRGFGPSDGRDVFEQIVLSQLARGATPAQATARAHDALARVHAERCAACKPGELSAVEAVRVAIARALARRPRLLVIDEPTLGLEALDRNAILSLLRTLADGGVAVLASTDQSAGLAGADRALSLSGGKLRGVTEPELASVVPLRRPA